MKHVTIQEVRQTFLQLLAEANNEAEVKNAILFKELWLAYIRDQQISEYTTQVFNWFEGNLAFEDLQNLDSLEDLNDVYFLYWEEWIDVRLLYRVRSLHFNSLNEHTVQEWAEEVSQDRLDKSLILDAQPEKHCVLLDTFDNGDKLYATDEGNFMVCAVQECDRPEWAKEQEQREQKLLYFRKLKYINATIRDSRELKDKYMTAYLRSWKCNKRLLHEFREQEHRFYLASQAKDKMKFIDKVNDLSKLLTKFCKFQAIAEWSLLESFTREYLKEKYLEKWLIYSRAIVNSKLDEAVEQAEARAEYAFEMYEAMAY